MINDNFDAAWAAGKRLDDEQQRFQAFVDETLDQMETKRIQMEQRESQLLQTRQRIVANQEEMDQALEEIHGQQITDEQRERMSALAQQLTDDRDAIDRLEDERSALQSDLDGAMEDLNAFADVLMMVDTLKSEFATAQSELIRVQTIVRDSGVEPSSHPLMNRLQQSYDDVERLTNVVERHRLQLAEERAA
ncbi:MAG: hypothetical protein AAF497_27345 [Planctomycetota bacterium]